MKQFDFSQKMATDIKLIDKETFNDMDISVDTLIKRFENNDSYVLYVKYIEENPAGFVGVMKAVTPHYFGWWIDLLAVRPSYQGNHLGQDMISFIKEEYKKDDQVITALVRKTNVSSIKSFLYNDFMEIESDYKLFICE